MLLSMLLTFKDGILADVFQVVKSESKSVKLEVDLKHILSKEQGNRSFVLNIAYWQ